MAWERPATTAPPPLPPAATPQPQPEPTPTLAEATPEPEPEPDLPTWWDTLDVGKVVFARFDKDTWFGHDQLLAKAFLPLVVTMLATDTLEIRNASRNKKRLKRLEERLDEGLEKRLERLENG
jgi:hypothetical protein